MLRTLLFLILITPTLSAQSNQRVIDRALQLFDANNDGQLSAQERAAAERFWNRDPNAKTFTFEVDGLQRTAIVYAPDEPQQPPLVFGFHGHGGNARNAARSFRLHDLWPEAVVVYMQGIPTPGPLTDPEGKRNGWQHSAGELGDRDLRFFDAVLAKMKAEFGIDASNVFSTGHSNGGGFTYLLWAQRPEVFTAMAPSASAASRQLKGLKPKPVLHIAGANDPLVRYQWQERTIEYLKQLNQTGDPVSRGRGLTVFPSTNGTPVFTLLHEGGHKFPQSAPGEIIAFFKEMARQRQISQ